MDKFLEIIREAARDLRTVIITYVNEKGEQTRREVQPYSLRPGKEGSVRFFGFDVTKGQIRGFRLDRIQNVEPTTNTFTPLWTVEF